MTAGVLFAFMSSTPRRRHISPWAAFVLAILSAIAGYAFGPKLF